MQTKPLTPNKPDTEMEARPGRLEAAATALWGDKAYWPVGWQEALPDAITAWNAGTPATPTDVSVSDGGDTCEECRDRFQTIYRVPNDVWAKIAPRCDDLGEYTEHQCGGVLCLPCADVAAREQGIVLRFDGRVNWNDTAPTDVGELVERPIQAPTETLPELVDRLSYMLGPDTDFDNYTFSIRRGSLRRLLAAALTSQSTQLSAMAEDNARQKAALALIESDCAFAISFYERNGPGFTSQLTGDEYEYASAVQDKMQELREIARLALETPAASGEGDGE